MEEKINAIKDALREVMQLLVQRGQPISPEIKTTLAQVMEYAAQRIQQLRQEEQTGQPSLETAEIEQAQVAEEVSPPQDEAIPTGGPTPTLEKGIPSSNIHSFAYNDKNGKLYVKFQGEYPQENGSVYEYSGVPINIFNMFRKGAIPARTDGKNKWGKWWKGKVPSMGASLYTLIKEQGFPYKKVS